MFSFIPRQENFLLYDEHLFLHYIILMGFCLWKFYSVDLILENNHFSNKGSEKPV